MPRILILFGTTDGHTAKIARFLAEELSGLGAVVEVYDAGGSNPDPGGYDGVVVAASVHVGGFQRPVIRWARAHRDELRGRPAAFLAVCLGVLQADLRVQRDLVAITNRFEERTGWKPSRVKLVAGALPYTRYGWLKRRMMRRIVAKAGGSTDVTRDHEYTDWGDLRAFAAGFAAPLGVPAAVPATAPDTCQECSCQFG